MTCGFGLAMAICVPFGFLNLEENMWFQFMSFVCLGLFTTEFVGQFAIEGLQPSRTPAFAEPNVFEAFGVVMFTYALGRVSDPCGRRTRAAPQLTSRSSIATTGTRSS